MKAEILSIGTEILLGEIVDTNAQYIAARLSAYHPDRPAWGQPVGVYFRRIDAGWKMVGLERNP